jgi:DNA polymerase (family 10)
MQNKKVASILNRVADYLEMDGVDFRTKAYRRAAHTIVTLSVDIAEVAEQDRLEELLVLVNIFMTRSRKYWDTGKLQYLEDLKVKFPGSRLIDVSRGLGQEDKILYHELGIKNLDDLEREAKRIISGD